MIHLKKKDKSDINKNYLNNVVKDYMMILNTSIAHIDRSVQGTFDLCLSQTQRLSGKHHTNIAIKKTYRILHFLPVFDFISHFNQLFLVSCLFDSYVL